MFRLAKGGNEEWWNQPTRLNAVHTERRISFLMTLFRGSASQGTKYVLAITIIAPTGHLTKGTVGWAYLGLRRRRLWSAGASEARPRFGLLGAGFRHSQSAVAAALCQRTPNGPALRVFFGLLCLGKGGSTGLEGLLFR